MTTKIDFINDAFDRGRISGLTRSPTPEDITRALKRLENMAHRWRKQNICTGYNFEETPDVNSPHNVPQEYWDAYETGLMMRLLSAYGKVATPELANDARTSFSWMSSQTAEVPEFTYPDRMPIGSGNRLGNRWGYRYNRYFPTVEDTPIGCATVKMAIDDVNNFYEDYSAYLNSGESISTCVITASTGLTISDESISGSRKLYTVTATGTSGEESSTLFKVKLVMTTDATPARIETRLRNFELTNISIT